MVAIDDVIGQGRVLASPLAMATVAALVADGQTVTPSIVEGTEALPSGDAAPLTDDESNQLQAMMRAAVVSGGVTSR